MSVERWTPRQSPDGVYCSPGCGFGCKRRDYDQAINDACEMASRLGSGWKPVIWENAGWHYKAEKGLAAVYGPTAGSFMAMINIPDHQFVAHGETAEDALGFAVQDARSAVRRIEDALAALLAEEAL